MDRPTNLRRFTRLNVEQLESRLVLSGVQPTVAEQLLLEQLNDIRANPKAYGDRIGVDLSGVAPSQPLAFNPQVIQVARQHAQDMNDRSYFSQQTPNGKDPGQRLQAAGINWISWGESSAAGSTYPDPASALQALITDADKPSHADRNQLLSIDQLFKTQNQVGVGIVQNGSGPLANYYTIDTIQGPDAKPFLTGVVYNDANQNGVYDAGEGLGGAQVRVQNGPSTTTFETGGYSLQLNPGTYTLTIQGGRLASPITQSISISTSNVRFNAVVTNSQLQSGNDAWVGLLYRDVLGRVPSTDEVTGWTTVLDNGATRDQVAQAFIGSAEFQQHLVGQFYTQYLQRPADPGGLSTFTSALSGGAKQDAVRFGILASTEYFANHGNNADSFVQALYQDLLGRTPQGSEAAGWVAQVNAGNRGGVVSGFLGSREFQVDEVQGLYSSLLRRTADSGGLDHFTNLLSQGQDLRAAEREIVMSTEYYTSAQNILFVQSLYHDVLGRSGDGAAELGAWLAQLNSGTSRTSVASAFTNSVENQMHIVRNLYQRLLARDADAGGLAYFVNILNQRGHVNDVISGITGSDEYYARNQGTPALFILALYRDFLNRGASNAEIQGWVGHLDSGETRQQVSQEFLASTEPRNVAIASLYNSLLGRDPTSVELGAIATRLQNGESDASIAASLLASDEYYEKAAHG